MQRTLQQRDETKSQEKRTVESSSPHILFHLRQLRDEFGAPARRGNVWETFKSSAQELGKLYRMHVMGTVYVVIADPALAKQANSATSRAPYAAWAATVSARSDTIVHRHECHIVDTDQDY